MGTEIIRNQSPEERELEKKRADLEALEAELAERELELETLRAEIIAFEARYLSIVGVRYAELDEIEAQIAEAHARRTPKDNRAQEQAAHARAQAEQSAQAAGAVQEGTEQKRFTASESLKKLYREAAKRIHPDLAIDEQDRARRQKLMVEANQAYADGNEADLIRVIRKIAQIEKRLVAIDAELAELRASDLYQLKTKVDEAKLQAILDEWESSPESVQGEGVGAENGGQDLLAQMALQVADQIAAAKERLAAR